MRVVYSLLFVVFYLGANAQPVSERIKNAYEKFESDSQLRSAISSLYVIEAETGKVVFEKNARIGMATASTLKVITAASAYAFLGKDFRYETKFGYTGKIRNKNLYGSLFIQPSGDPTFGSWRWPATKDSVILKKISDALKKENINGYAGIAVNNNGQAESIPGGWIWEDLGNYYGAGAGAFNWRENQVDVVLQSGENIGDKVKVLRTEPKSYSVNLQSQVQAAPKGSGDNAYVYYGLNTYRGVVRGTIPAGENNFKISASVPQPDVEFYHTLTFYLAAQNIKSIHYEGAASDSTFLFSHYSPPLDSMVYWFLKKSINLYGEALVKTIAYQKKTNTDTDEGIALIKAFWKDKGIDPIELNMVDGSGLSPQNRVTTHAQVQVLHHARTQPWFNGFFQALPLYNDMKMKSGTIRGTKGFCGYHTSKAGSTFIFSFLVNNYNGSATTLVQKMYKVLNELK